MSQFVFSWWTKAKWSIIPFFVSQLSSQRIHLRWIRTLCKKLSYFTLPKNISKMRIKHITWFLHNVQIHRQCILCEPNCESKKEIMDHLAFVHHEKTNCDMCDFQVYPFERLKRHLILRHKICSKCGEKFETSMELENHFETVHSDKKLADSLR